MTLRITTAFLLLCAMHFPQPAPAQTYTTLYTFCDAATCPDGTDPRSGLIQAADGNFYGTTYYGGANSAGVVYKISPSGTYTVVANFGGPNEHPVAGLMQATDGAFYGTAGGSIFKLTPDGSLITLASEAGSSAGLIEGEDGDLYGTTTGGGNLGNGVVCDFGGISGCGTVFKVTTSGTLTTLYEFCSQDRCTDGFNPYAGLVETVDGAFYGTNAFGGRIEDCFNATGCGTVFKLTPSGSLTEIYRFPGPDSRFGVVPLAGVIQGNDGNFYGTTSGVVDNGCGTVFKIANGTLTTLHKFYQPPTCAVGSSPRAGLVQGTDGNFYGTTLETIFKITPSGKLTTLYAGGSFITGLIQGTDGSFYGTSGSTVFRLSVGLGPFVVTQRTIGRVGSLVNILGTDLSGATSVTFNGIPATFLVISPTEIKTTVPPGATTGFVQVVTPDGTLSSNLLFRVKQ